MSDEERLELLRDELTAEGYYNLRVIPNQGICGISKFIFTTAIVVGITNVGYRGRYCYPHELVKDCLIAFTIWNGIDNPIGDWIKFKGAGEEFCNPNNIE